MTIKDIKKGDIVTYRSGRVNIVNKPGQYHYWFNKDFKNREFGCGFEHYDDTNCDIQTLEGVMHANYGDYIIKGVKGEIYPCKPDIFEETYEILESQE